jgi:Zn-dependent protease with chaperone function
MNLMQEFIYPLSPENANLNVLKPSKDYKIEAFKVSLAIILFVAIYFLLIMLSLFLAAGISYLGIMLILFKAMFATLMIGIGMIGTGLMVIFFLIKFLFNTRKIDRSGLYEIKRKDYPALSSFIDKVSIETRAPKPKRIYLSPEVNASVFYDSSLLSMFFPVRKNLLIGLGFVNSVNMSEFKAVLAHEFGHFSQHSMRLGSYVFNVNKIIYNMLYDNEGYANALDTWAGASGYFTLFARLTVKIVQIIQGVLKKVYVVVNKSNLSLSRQMEHHADAVSAFVCGPRHIVNALKRLELSDTSYNILLNNYNKWITENLKPDNIYIQHTEVLHHFAEENNYALEYGLPVFDLKCRSGLRQSRIIMKDQWSSHPSTAEREKYLATLDLKNVPPVNEKPWILFGDPVKTQKLITDKLFSGVKYEGTVNDMDLASFKEKYYSEFDNNTYNKEYRGYYNNRRIKAFVIDEPFNNEVTKYCFEELFSDNNCSLPNECAKVESELQILSNLESQKKNINSFEFDGKKCTSSEVPNLIKQLEQEKLSLLDKIEYLDKEIAGTVLAKCDEESKSALKDLYLNYFKLSTESELSVSNYTELSNEIYPIFSRNMPFNEAREVINRIRTIERRIIEQIKSILDEAREQKYVDESQLKKLDWYLSKERSYLDASGFNNVSLEVMHEAMIIFINLMSAREFRIKKNLLNMQLKLFNHN